MMYLEKKSNGEKLGNGSWSEKIWALNTRQKGLYLTCEATGNSGRFLPRRMTPGELHFRTCQAAQGRSEVGERKGK